MDRQSAPATPAILLPTGGQPTARCRRAGMSRLCQQQFYPFAVPEHAYSGRWNTATYLCHRLATRQIERALMTAAASTSFMSEQGVAAKDMSRRMGSTIRSRSADELLAETRPA
jgi:hypothetical protein